MNLIRPACLIGFSCLPLAGCFATRAPEVAFVPESAPPAAGAAASAAAPPALGEEVPLRVARLAYIEGPVTTQRVQDEDWSDGQLNLPLLPGDKLYVGKNGRAEIELEDEVVIRLAAESYLVFEALDDSLARLRLARGTFMLHAWHVDYPRPPVQIASRLFTAVVDDHASARFDVAEEGPAEIRLHRGELRLLPAGEAPEVGLQRDQRVMLDGLAPPGIEIARDDGREDGFDQWCDMRDAVLASSRSQHHITPRVSGIQDLERYGDWIEVPDHGEVWQPRVTAVGWAPYRHGRWACRPPFGWIWVADEPWGWAPYHYGRWVCLEQRNWCWVPCGIRRGRIVTPGPRPVWYPAVVTFAYLGGPNSLGNSLERAWWPRPCVGWFPLGPADAFIPWYHPHHAVANARTHAICYNAVHVRQLPATGGPDICSYQNWRVPDAVTLVPQDDFNGEVYVNRRAVTLDEATVRTVKTGPDAVSAMATGDGILTAHRVTRSAIAPGLSPPSIAPAGTRSVPGVRADAPPEKLPRADAGSIGIQEEPTARSLATPTVEPQSVWRGVRPTDPSARLSPRPLVTTSRSAPSVATDSAATRPSDAARRLAERSLSRSIRDRSTWTPGFSPSTARDSGTSSVLDLRHHSRASVTSPRPSSLVERRSADSPTTSPRARIGARPDSSSSRPEAPSSLGPVTSRSSASASSSSHSVRVVPRSGSASRGSTAGRAAPAPPPAPAPSLAPAPSARSNKIERRSAASSSRAASSIAPVRPSIGPAPSAASRSGGDAGAPRPAAPSQEPKRPRS